ncbi:MAG: sterol desaturase family protein [Pseudomonadota bacterium]
MDTLWTALALAAYIVGQWGLFHAVAVFPLLLLAVRLIRRAKAGLPLNAEAFALDSDAVWSVANNVALAVINTFIWMALLVGVYGMIDAFWTQTVGIDRFSMIGGWPFWLQLAFALIVLDFKNYWSHRLLHRPWMWEIHSLHHSDRHMNFSTTTRIHVLEAVQMSLVGLVILGWFDMPVVVAGVAGVMRLWYSFYIHSGLPFDHGRLRKILASPNYHRWHHADDPAVYGKNLCDMFPVWDLMFGTHHDPGWCDRPTGVSDAPDDMLRGQLHPFLRYAAGLRDWALRNLVPGNWALGNRIMRRRPSAPQSKVTPEALSDSAR